MDKEKSEFNYFKIYNNQSVNTHCYNQFLDTSVKVNALLNEQSATNGKGVMSMVKSKENLITVQKILIRKVVFL